MSRFNTSSLDRSWVDLFTNSSFVNNFDNSSLSNIWLDQTFPKEIFFSFIHEATHHWCFTSLVGNALFLVKMRAFLLALKLSAKDYKYKDPLTGLTFIKDEDNNDKWNIYTDYTRFETVDKILKPLAEGMALFSEFDTYPTDTEGMPPYLVYISMMFSGIKRTEFIGKTISDFENAYKDFLIERRFISEEGINRKSELLVSSIFISESPYLPGYLLIKNMQGILIERNEKFKDPNFFLEFVREYYFNDLGLVSKLLDSTIRNEDVVPTIMKHFNLRISQLNSLPSCIIDEFEKEIHDTKKNNFYKFFTDEETVESGLKLLDDQFDNLFKNSISHDLWYMRSFFRVTKLKCYIKINQENILVYLTLPISMETNQTIVKFLDMGMANKRNGHIDVFTASFPNFENDNIFEGEAIFEKYVSFQDVTKKFEVFILEGRQIFFPFVADLWTTEEIRNIVEYFKSKKTIFDEMNFDDIIKMTWDKDDPAISTIEEFHISKNYNILYDYCENLSLYCSNSMLQKVKFSMKDTGFWEILDHREDLVYLLSFISLISSNCCKPFSCFENLFSEAINYTKLHELENKLMRYDFKILKVGENSICTHGI